jgi:hypothetical protein
VVTALGGPVCLTCGRRSLPAAHFPAAPAGRGRPGRAALALLMLGVALAAGPGQALGPQLPAAALDGQGTGPEHGDLLCAAARYMAATLAQRKPGQEHRDADLAGLAAITAALARTALALAGQQPQTRACSRLSAASGCLQAASRQLSAAVDDARRPPAGQRRTSRDARNQPTRQPER